MQGFAGKLAVITGGGTGMGRALAELLAAEGCHVAICDVSADNMAETRQLCVTAAPAGVRVTTHPCDVSEERQVLAFRDAVLREHATDHIHLLFNNAGIGGGGSFLDDDRDEWERTFGVCWWGVYYCSRAFLPLLVASDGGAIVNTSSVNGFWACLGEGIAHTAYSSAKFAVKGFTEALIVDLRLHAPHVKAALVMPGHVGTSIVFNTAKLHGRPDALKMSAEDVAKVKEQMKRRGLDMDAFPDEAIRQGMHAMATRFRDAAPTSAEQAAKIILDGVRRGEWRILIGDDAVALDRIVRAAPEQAYEPGFTAEIQKQGHMRWS
jgi:NAD(P)-dependent dehydrogenase (short-subunit alcohol dehydrogenase family)